LTRVFFDLPRFRGPRPVVLNQSPYFRIFEDRRFLVIETVASSLSDATRR
jgi:hypothetical protein